MSQNQTLSSVKCDVSSCVHNVNGSECSANSISVCSTCSCPDCCDETQCRTFKSKQ